VRNFIVPVALVTALSVLPAYAAERGGAERGGGAERAEGGGAAERGEERTSAPRTETQAEPRGYKRLERPSGAEARPRELDRHTLNHNYNAARTFHIGPYHAPAGWEYTRWQYGQALPVEFWAEQYRLPEYWLFGLDLPPVGYEWVRYGSDALLVSMTNGEIIQSTYGLFP